MGLRPRGLTLVNLSLSADFDQRDLIVVKRIDPDQLGIYMCAYLGKQKLVHVTMCNPLGVNLG